MAKEGARVGYSMLTFMGQARHEMVFAGGHSAAGSRKNQFFTPQWPMAFKWMSMPFPNHQRHPSCLAWPNVTAPLIAKFWRKPTWDDLDYFGSSTFHRYGRLQLTLAQKVPVAGSVHCTTPQDIALPWCASWHWKSFNKVKSCVGVVEHVEMQYFLFELWHHEPSGDEAVPACQRI